MNTRHDPANRTFCPKAQHDGCCPNNNYRCACPTPKDTREEKCYECKNNIYPHGHCAECGKNHNPYCGGDTTEQHKELREEELAILFHDTYERLAPSFGYETREDTKQFDPQSKNGKLMIAVCKEINDHFITAKVEEARREGYKNGKISGIELGDMGTKEAQHQWIERVWEWAETNKHVIPASAMDGLNIMLSNTLSPSDNNQKSV